MIRSDLHRLLKRQIIKSNLDESQVGTLNDFIKMINDSYQNFDKDFAHIENILELSSQELFIANKALKDDVAHKDLMVKKAHDQLAFLVNTVQGIIFQTNEKGNYTFLNKSWETLTGYKVEDSLGKHFTSFFEFIKNDKEAILKQLEDRTELNVTSSFAVEFESGNERWIELNINRIFDEFDNFEGVIGTFIDITDQKKIEQNLRIAREEAVSASQAKNDFLSTMSHEIRTPLNAVIGISNLLLLDDPKDSQLENLDALKYSSEHLLGLINDVLDFNKIESGKLEFEKVEFSLADLLSKTKKTFEVSAKEKGLRFQLKYDTDLPTFVFGDSMRLSQVLSNLISNAIKFTDEGKVTIDVELLQEKDNQCDIGFTISDTGIGIPESKQELVFESFRQAEKFTTKRHGGTGLGLAICKQLVELQNGKISLESQEGRGSTFSVQMSFEKSNMVELQKSSTEAAKKLEKLTGMHILMAEDNPLNVLVIKQFFARWDIKLTLAANGAEAIEKFKEEDVDLVLMDLQMPIMDGYTATAEIRKIAGEKYQSTPIVALTASAQIDVKEKARSLGMNDFLLKPFNPVELHEKLRSYYKN